MYSVISRCFNSKILTTINTVAINLGITAFKIIVSRINARGQILYTPAVFKGEMIRIYNDKRLITLLISDGKSKYRIIFTIPKIKIKSSI